MVSPDFIFITMKTSTATCWQAAWTIIGGVIGAGFATGREVWEFFGVHPTGWRAGVVLATALMFAGTTLLMWLGQRTRARHYNDLLIAIWGQRLAVVADAVAAMALYTGLVVVLAGTGELADHMLGMGVWAGLTAGGIVLAVLGRGEPQGLIRLQALLVPALMVLWALIWWATAGTASPPVPGHVQLVQARPWWLSACLYASYNLLLVAAVVPAVASHPRAHKGHAPTAAALASGILGIVTWGLLARLRALAPLAAKSPLPLGSLASAAGAAWSDIYVVALLLALITTGVVCLYGLCSRWTSPGKGRTFLAWGLIVSALPWASLGLVTTVGILYPLLGWVGMATLAVMIIRLVRR